LMTRSIVCRNLGVFNLTLDGVWGVCHPPGMGVGV
jgi:hypothetical protein